MLAYQRKHNAPELEQKVLLCAAVFCVAILDALGIFFGVLAMRHSGNGTVLEPDAIIKLTNIAIGILLIVLGNIMPKARLNAYFGLRTKWSMANDRVWQRSQRFRGYSGVACGLLTIIVSIILPGKWVFAATSCIATVWIVLCMVASYSYWKQDADDALV